MKEPDRKRSPEELVKILESLLLKIQLLPFPSRILKFLRVQFLLRSFPARGSATSNSSSSSSNRKKRSKKNLFRWFFLTFGLVLVYCYFIRSRISVSKYDKCLFELPAFAQKLFRPAEDCSICENVQQVEKLASVSPEVFEERYAYSGKPVVITDATKNWTAIREFSFDFFKSLYGNQESANCQFFPYKTEFENLQQVFGMDADRAAVQDGTDSWYVGWSNCDEKIGGILRQHYQRPYFLPVTAESEKTDWIFMGSRGYGAPMHVDDVDYPSWQAQIKGSKLWILEPPRECFYTCSRLEVTVNPGEIIVLDTNRWYHQTSIVSKEVSITIGAEYD